MGRASALLLAALSLAACEAKIGSDQPGNGVQRAAAEGKAEAGVLSIDAPGFDMKLKIPESIRAEVGTDTALIYPGATLAGLHVAANADSTKGASGSVEMRFTTPDALEKVAAWYRDPARAAELAVSSAVREGTGLVMTGTRAGEGDPFTLHLAPASGGGTEARLTLSDRSG